MDNDMISRSALYKAWDALDETQDANLLIDAMIKAAQDAPDVDAVEVVRCRDCKHWGTGYGGETEHIKVCEFANYMVGENGYCVYGERKMDAEVEG